MEFLFTAVTHHCSGGTDDQAHPAPAPWAFLFGTVVAFLVRLIYFR